MGKVIRKLFTLLLAVFIGFWLSASGILQGTELGNWLDRIVSYIPTPETWSEMGSLELDIDQLSKTAGSSVDTEPEDTVAATPASSEVNYSIVEDKIFTLLNELRLEKGLNTLQRNDMLKKAADLRAVETETLFSHTRPNGTDAFTVFKEEDIDYAYQVVGENLGMATNYLEETEMAELLFNGWVESEGHYENMVRPEYEEIGIGVHYDGEFLYATQIFGTPMY